MRNDEGRLYTGQHHQPTLMIARGPLPAPSRAELILADQFYTEARAWHKPSRALQDVIPACCYWLILAKRGSRYALRNFWKEAFNAGPDAWNVYQFASTEPPAAQAGARMAA